MVGLAQLSPSWCNSQPWQVIVTEGKGTERLREALYAHALEDTGQGGAPNLAPDFDFPSAYRGVYKERQREVGWQLYESVGIAYGDRKASAEQAMKNFRLFDAPHMLLITSERDLGTYGAVDCGVYLSSLLLAAQSLGIASIPQAALAGYAPFMREHFNIPENRMIVAGVSFGYADGAHPSNSFRSKRASIDDTVQWVTM
jgi:nitroreductase